MEQDPIVSSRGVALEESLHCGNVCAVRIEGTGFAEIVPSADQTRFARQRLAHQSMRAIALSNIQVECGGLNEQPRVQLRTSRRFQLDEGFRLSTEPFEGGYADLAPQRMGWIAGDGRVGSLQGRREAIELEQIGRASCR